MRLARPRRILGGLLAALMMAGLFVAGPGAGPANAALGDPSALTVTKTVQGEKATTVVPGGSFDYYISGTCSDNPCIDAALSDALPDQFAGFTLQTVAVTPAQHSVTITGGCSVGQPVVTGCDVDVDFQVPLGDIGGEPQYGLNDGQSYSLVIILTAPLDLQPTWPHNGQPVVNTAVATWDNALGGPGQVEDTATVTVNIPVTVDVEVSKTWLPSGQQFNPGEVSTITTTVRNASNVFASSLVLQDPSAATTGGPNLDASNPFNYVNFVALCTPTSVTFPSGADRVQIDALYLSGGVWNWVAGTAAATPALPGAVSDPALVGGLRVTFTSSTGNDIAANGAAGSLCFDVAQRANHRTSGADLSSGWTADNIASGTVNVPGHQPVTKTDNATLTIGPMNVLVQAGKTINPSRIPAGSSTNVSITAKNNSNAALTSLTINEPQTMPGFFTDKVTFGGFTGRTWPTGAHAATLTWHLSDSSTIVITPILEGDPLPALPSLDPGEHIVGFTVVYSGSIIAGTTAGWDFTVDTASDTVASPVSLRFDNTVGVSGTNSAGTANDSAPAPLDVFYPDISIAIDKDITPDVVTPGGMSLARLIATTSSDSAHVRPTEIVVEDRMLARAPPAPADYWDSHRVRELVGISIPMGATMSVQYSTTLPPTAPNWVDYATGLTGVYSTDFSALPGGTDRDDITGLRFVFSDPAGFGQSTSVQPNIAFQAAQTLRDGLTPTDTLDSPADDDAAQVATDYVNTAQASATGMAGSLPVASGVVTDSDTIGVIVYQSGGGQPGPGNVLIDKDWRRSGGLPDPPGIRSQSGDSLRTLQHWGVTTPGYSQVTLTDAHDPTADPATTVYQAFNLTRIFPIVFDNASSDFYDPLMRWDRVVEVALYTHTTSSWTVLPAPAGNWMNASGFKGFSLSSAQQQSTTGVRIVIEENAAARTASTDPTRPAAGSGVASAVSLRPVWFDWELRNTLRVPGVDPDDTWVVGHRGYNIPSGTGNCAPVLCGQVRNTFGVAAVHPGGVATRQAQDDITIFDVPPAVSTEKTITPGFVIAPHLGDVPVANYPTAVFQIRAWNTSQANTPFIRSMDPIPCVPMSSCALSPSNHSPDVYTGQTYDPATNPFERFTITKITFAFGGGTNISRPNSMVALWKRATDGTLTVDQMTMTAAEALLPAALVDVVGVSVVYQSADPLTTGGMIPQQGSNNPNRPTMTLDTRLRDTLRSDPLTAVTGLVTVTNSTFAQSIDPILAPSGPTSIATAATTAPIEIRSAFLDVTASKDITPGSLVESNPSVPLTVTLGATDGLATLSAQQVTITDVDAGFWAMFRITGLVSTTRPAGADLVRAEVQLNGDPTWIPGAAGANATLPAADLEEVTGIRFIYYRSDGLPFSNTVPSADWSAQAVFTVVLRDADPFPTGQIDNEITATAWHEDYPEVSADAVDIVTFSQGVAMIDVQKESNETHLAAPGEYFPWTLRFTNSGTSFLDIVEIVDDLGTHLEWDGEPPTFSTSGGGTLPTTGITVTQPTPTTLKFEWDDPARMQPGESFLITLRIALLPGLTPAQRATNSFIVTTEQTLSACTNTSGNGQGTIPDLSGTECGTTNYVSPINGPLIFAQKSVQGEVDGTLVDGATNVNNPEAPCIADGAGFYRLSCAAHTVIGAQDTWRLRVVNAGTVAYANIVVVDVLPRPGDVLLATGAPRGSQFRPVLVDVDPPSFMNMPAGSVATWEVTTDAQVCLAAGPVTDWPTDPTCSGVTWVLGSAYSGDPENITAVRWSVDFTGTTAGNLPPGGGVELRFNTVNTPAATAESPSITWPVGPQQAWNQFGVHAMTTTNVPIRVAPSRTGVITQIAALEIAKVLEGTGVAFAPDSFTLTLECEIAGVPLVMGSAGTVIVPANDSVTVGSLPLGASCAVTDEPGSGGAHDIDLGDSVSLVDTELIPTITVTNTFVDGPLAVLKNRVGPGADRHGTGPFQIQVTCMWEPDGVETALPLPDGGSYPLSEGNGYRVDIASLPVGAWCEVEETDAGAASKVTMDPVDGRIQIVASGGDEPVAIVTITNHFDDIANTGGMLFSLALWFGAGLLLIGTGFLVTSRRRRTS